MTPPAWPDSCSEVTCRDLATISPKIGAAHHWHKPRFDFRAMMLALRPELAAKYPAPLGAEPTLFDDHSSGEAASMT